MKYSLLIILLTLSFSFAFAHKGCYENLCQRGNEKNDKIKIKKLLKKYMKRTIRMGETVIEPVDKSSYLRSASPKERNLCHTKQVTVFPKFDKHFNLSVVNIKEFRQNVILETCDQNPSKCSNSKIFNYITTCKQIFNKVRLLYYNGTDLEYKLTTIPTACVCAYKKQLS